MKLSAYVRDFVALLYPEVCEACSNPLHHGEEVVCTFCHYKLPYARFHHEPGNPIEQIFWGRIPIESATSLFYFSKGNKVRNLLHNLKYRKHQYIGPFLGQILAKKIQHIPRFQGFDYITPVPLHPKRLRLRGFNQSMAFADGIAENLNSKSEELLFRTVDSSSQTKKNRFDRFKNMDGIFKVIDPSKVEGKKVLLVDDILTTGSTLEGSATPLIESGARVSIATMAMVQ